MSVHGGDSTQDARDRVRPDAKGISNSATPSGGSGGSLSPSVEKRGVERREKKNICEPQRRLAEGDPPTPRTEPLQPPRGVEGEAAPEGSSVDNVKQVL